MAHLKVCVVLQGSQSSSTIAKVLANIVAHPAEAKYRKLRLANKRIQETVVDVDGGVELLQVQLLAVSRTAFLLFGILCRLINQRGSQSCACGLENMPLASAGRLPCIP